MKKKAVIYARVSTEDQAEHGYSLQSQIEACELYADSQSFQIEETITDDCSGAKLERPGLDLVRDQIDQNIVDAIIVYTDDRLSRNLAHSLLLREEWRSKEIEIHTVTRGILEDTAEGRLTENIHAVIAEYEREKIRERTRRGRIAKARSGKPVLMGNPPFGYLKEGKGRNGKLVRNEEELHVVQTIFEWYVNGNGNQRRLSLREIARRLNQRGALTPTSGIPWSNIGIHRVLASEIYAGVTHYGKTKVNNGIREKQPRDKWIEIPVPHLAVIDRSLFDAVQEIKKRNIQLSKRNRKRKYLMSGFFRCGTCGSVMVGYQRQGHLRYQCSKNWKRPHEEPCLTSNRSVVTHKIDNVIWDWLCWLLSDDANLEAGLNEMANQREFNLEDKRRNMKTIEGLIIKKERTVERLISEMARNESIILDAFRKEIKGATDQKKALQAEYALLCKEIESKAITEEMWEGIMQMAANVRQRLPNATYKDKRWLMDVLKVKVKFVVDGEKPSLHVRCDLPYSDMSIAVRASQKIRRPTKHI